MTVKELIAELSRVENLNSPVVIYLGDNGGVEQYALITYTDLKREYVAVHGEKYESKFAHHPVIFTKEK